MDNLTLIYDILWTSPDFPSAEVYHLNSDILVSDNSILVFQLTSKFLPIGPAFNFYINSTPSIEPTMIDSSLIKVTS